ncbi:MAG: 4Fe-4S dicluster domain-containing protein, partial [Gemmatimonadetes bacterium]|nr:4Fe-4S dicluster domain-containing protein [Gemmatimonadota bacterium]
VALEGSPLARELDGLDRCVHCCFCLTACPTYLALEDENDSPRGRLVMMRALAEGTVALDDAGIGTHLDRCLGCRGCETACPSGVPYGALLEATRATIAHARPLPLVARLLLAVFAHAWLRVPAMAVARLLRASGLAALGARLPGRVGQASAMLASTAPALPRPGASRVQVAGAPGDVALLHGCVMDGLFAHVHDATRTVLAANGYALRAAPGQGCCGALHAHAGDHAGAQALARTNIAAFEASGAAFVAVNSAGCGAMCKEYGHLLADDAAWAARARAFGARVRDVSELLASAGPARGGALPLTVTCDQPCHLQHAQRLVAEPARVIDAVPGLAVRTLADADQCCGSAGIYNLVEPDVAARVLAPKLAAIAATGAPLVASGNPGCHMHIGAGLVRSGSTARVVHPVELLAASYARGAAD